MRHRLGGQSRGTLTGRRRRRRARARTSTSRSSKPSGAATRTRSSGCRRAPRRPARGMSAARVASRTQEVRAHHHLGAPRPRSARARRRARASRARGARPPRARRVGGGARRRRSRRAGRWPRRAGCRDRRARSRGSPVRRRHGRSARSPTRHASRSWDRSRLRCLAARLLGRLRGSGSAPSTRSHAAAPAQAVGAARARDRQVRAARPHR